MTININHYRSQFRCYLIPLSLVCLLWVIAIVLLIVIIEDFLAERRVETTISHQQIVACECPRQNDSLAFHQSINDTIELDADYYRYLTRDLLRNAPYPGVENYTLYTMDRLAVMDASSKEESIRADYGPVLNDITSFQYLHSVHTCWNNLTKKYEKTLFAAIISAPVNMEKREWIRKTWLSRLTSISTGRGLGLAGYAFIIGRTEDKDVQDDIDFESQLFDDIVQVDMVDSYYNLTLKVTGLLNWLHLNCPKVDFVLKVDDDVYVNVRNLAATLPNLTTNHTMYGYRSTSPPLRGIYSIIVNPILH